MRGRSRHRPEGADVQGAGARADVATDQAEESGMTTNGADLKQVRVSAPSSSVLTSQTLPPELMAEAARRLPWLGLVFSVTYILNRVGQRLVMGMTGTILPGPA